MFLKLGELLYLSNTLLQQITNLIQPRVSIQQEPF